MIIYDKEFIDNPLVSVIIFTYNQAQYISRTIDSILSQRTCFNYEIIIGDDYSIDNTREILLTYQNNNKSKIKLVFQAQNIGIVGNYSKTLSHCRGKYIAQCAGDDYWIDNSKLQKQVDILEKRNDYVLVHTNGFALSKRKLIPLKTWDKMEGDVQKTFWYGSIVTTCTPCFRSELINHIDFDDFVKRGITTEDWATFAVFSKYGKFAYINDRCAVKRSNSFCVSRNNKYYLFYHLGLINIKRFLRDVVFPQELNDVYSEIALKQEEVYYKIRNAFINFDYASAKLFASDIDLLNSKSKKYVMYSKSILFFYIAATMKKLMTSFNSN